MVLVKLLRSVADPGGVPVRNFVHPIDKAKHPLWAGHYRWCVSIGDDPTNVELMLQAGVSNTAAAACKDGDMYAAAVVNAFRVVGVAVEWNGPTLLEIDPTPQEAA